MTRLEYQYQSAHRLEDQLRKSVNALRRELSAAARERKRLGDLRNAEIAKAKMEARP